MTVQFPYGLAVLSYIVLPKWISVFGHEKNPNSPSTSNPDYEERGGAINNGLSDESETKLWHAVADEYCTMTFPHLKDC